MAVREPALGTGGAPPARHWPGSPGRGGAACDRVRLPLLVSRHVFVSGAELLSEVRLRGIRPARLPAGPPADLSEEAAESGVAPCRCASKAVADAARHCASAVARQGAMGRAADRPQRRVL